MLWNKANEFESGTNFTAWACRIAYYQTLAYFERQKRERLRFDDRLMERLAADAEQRSERYDAKVHALRRCMKKLPEKQRALLEQRYTQGASVQTIANDLGRTAASLSVSLYRIRRALMKCIKLTEKKQLAAEDIAFMIAPRLNAAGRLGQAQLGIELL